MATSIREIKEKIRMALERGNLNELARLRHFLEVERQRRYRAELAVILVPIMNQIKIAIAENRTSEMRSVLNQAAGSVERWFQQTLYTSARSNTASWIDDLVKTMSPDQLRALTRLGIDNAGRVMPAAGSVDDITFSQSITRKELLAHLAPLLWVRNSKIVSETVELPEILVPNRDHIVARAVESHDPATSRHWRDKVLTLRNILTGIAIEVERLLVDKPLRAVLDFVEKKLGLTNQRTGYAWLVLNELRHESIRSKSSAGDALINSMPTVVSGYTLRSRFLPTTDIVHAANDGKRWYRDNRVGSFSSWETRLVPPYRKNCVCYTQPIIDTPSGDEFHAEFGLPGDRKNLVVIRDAKSFEDWFDAQSPEIQQTVMGLRRWMAAASLSNGLPKFASFVGTNGRPIGIRRLMREGIGARRNRMDKVRGVIDRQSRMIRSAQESVPQTKLRPDQEKRFASVLGKFLDKILK